MIYGDAEVKQAFNKNYNYNITAKVDINLEEKRSKAREIIDKLTEEEKSN